MNELAPPTRGATVCRTCDSTRLERFLDLGRQPIANRYVDPSEPADVEPCFPLDVMVCLDCALIQLPDRVPAAFFRHYLYVPSASDTLAQHFESLAACLAERGFVRPDGYVVDVGCNEGVLLAACARRGMRVLGVDPAQNIAERARARGIEVVTEYFGPDVAQTLVESRGHADVITTTNTFNHVDDLLGFVDAVRTLLTEDGVFVVEVPHAAELVENTQFDTIYHEHVSEFSLQSMVALYERAGLVVFDVERLPIHGGSMRVFAQPKTSRRPIDARVARFLDDERARGSFERRTYDAFRARTEALRAALLALVGDLRRAGKTIAAYGSPAKGMTLLAYCGLGPDDLRYVVDRSPLKQGRLTPGTRIPIVSPEAITTAPTDVLLLLAWNYLDEVRVQQADFLASGGRFLVPIPTPRLVGAEAS